MSSKILKEALIQQKEIQEEAEAQIPGATSFAILKQNTNIPQFDEEDLDRSCSPCIVSIQYCS